ncbi:MAG: hypothetical protein CTY24_09330, partial [Methylobacter sp.]
MTNTRNLERQINKQFLKKEAVVFYPPEIIIPVTEKGCLNENELNVLKQKKLIAKQEIELFDDMLMELMLVENPEYKKLGNELLSLFKVYKDRYLGGHNSDNGGSWVYYNNTLIHLLKPKDHLRLRTSRNLGLLTKDEQEKISNLHIAVGGLSVGGLCAVTLAMEGVNSFYLTDFDHLACSNLNRISSSISMIGMKKTDIVAQRIWDIDPFATIFANENGYNKETEHHMFNSERKPDVVIDAMDSMEAKIAIREACRQHRVPLVWMIDMGDGVVQIGTERYDLDANYKAFHGGLEKMEQHLGRTPSYVESCFGIFNRNYLPYRMAESFYLACNNQWPGISQLAGTVSIAAGAISRVVRKIALNEEINP